MRDYYSKLLTIPRGQKRIFMLVFDLVAIPLALWTAFIIRTGEMFSPMLQSLYYVLPVFILVTIAIFVRLGLYRAIVRFMGNEAINAIIKGVTISTLILAALILLYRTPSFPRSVLFIYWLLAMMYVGGSRYLLRSYFNPSRAKKQRHKAVIYGAGRAGYQLSVMLQTSGDIEPVCFIDDNTALQKSYVNGLRVYLPVSLSELINNMHVDQVLIAIPSATRLQKKFILDALESYSIHVFTVPDFSDIVSGRASVADLREIEINDLLGRDVVLPIPYLQRSCIEGKVVMITGAGGSIGSELCRQIISLQVKHLVLFDSSEYALYQVEQELIEIQRQFENRVSTTAVLGNIQNYSRVKQIISNFNVDTIYHAAAYKHVPMVENNLIEGVRNNIFGTLETAKAAIDCCVETFVLISTDKAVRPINVMGATKRFSELILQSLANEISETRFCIVRFGNVLGSSGSVVPVFNRQIKNGGPVTVTHPDVERFFMTMPEAAQLVIQAGSMGTGGDVFVLDMGHPVKIADLAKKMIHLSGLKVQSDDCVDGDIRIEYIGLRPGEKLYEELLIGDNVSGTEHRMIMRAEEHFLTLAEIKAHLLTLETAMIVQDCSAIQDALVVAVNGYRPSGQLFEPCLENLHSILDTGK